MGPRARRALAALAVLAIAALAAGCGGDDDDGPDGPKVDLEGARVEWGEPKGGEPTGVMMLIHGGGWQRSDSGYEEQKNNAVSLQDQGYATVAVGYDEGVKGFSQVQAVYKEAQRRYPDLPICATGISAGGHLALMLATKEPELTCVAALSAPTDLTTLADQDPTGDEAYNAAVEAFGEDQLARFSPVRFAGRIRAKVLLILAEDDPLAPEQQGEELTDALPGAEVLYLPPGPVPAVWAHGGGVEEDALDTVISREVEFLQEATQPG